MVIITTVLGMASISLKGFFASRRTADAAAQILALLQYARSQAVAEGRIYRFNLDADEGRYWLTAQSGGAYESPPSEFGRVFLLPEGTRARLEMVGTAAAEGRISFFPDGRAEPARISLVGRQEETAEIACESPAERFRIVAMRTGGGGA